MTEFEQVLGECLSALEQGASNVEGFLARHPKHAAQLEQILLIAEGLEKGRTLEPSPAFKARARAKLTSHMQAHPRRAAQLGFVFWRFATSFVMLVLALLTAGTAYAQSALPGDIFYTWKLASERAWRAISFDPINTDLAIAHRRIDEMNAVTNDPVRSALALEGYLEVLIRLQSELNAETLEQLLPQIEIEQEPIENPEQLIPTLSEGTETPLPNLPGNNPTVVPEIAPTFEIPPTAVPNIIPTTEILPTSPSDILPTAQIPPVLP